MSKGSNITFILPKNGYPFYNFDDPGAFDGNTVEQQGEENNP